MKTLNFIYRLFLVLVVVFFFAALYQYNLLPEFINQTKIIFNTINFHLVQLF